MKLFRLVALITFAVSLLAGCGSAGAPTGAISPTAPATQVPDPTAAPAPTAATAPETTAPAGDVVVVFSQSGGIANLQQTLTIYSDGRLELVDRDGATKTGQVSPDELAPVEELLSSSDFAALQSSYQAPGNDRFVYQISVPGAGKTRRISTMEGSDHPQVLADLIDRLRALRDKVPA